MITQSDAEELIEEFLDADRSSPECEASQLASAALEALPYSETVPGQWYRVAWAHVRLTLELEPSGTWYRGHRVAWVGGSQPGEWLHEVDGDADHRFETLTQALVFVDVLES